jgi:hypothetical protein
LKSSRAVDKLSHAADNAWKKRIDAKRTNRLF